MTVYHILRLLCTGALLLVMMAWLTGCTSLPPLRVAPPQYKTAAGAQARQLHTPDGITLFGQWWLPAATTEPRAVILLVHGTALHSGFYAPWANELTKHGFAVFGVDLRGWGQSQGYGREGYVRSYDEYIADVQTAYREVHARFPDKQLFLQGESLGGTVVLLVSSLHAVPNNGLILNAPAVKPNPGMGYIRAPGFLAGLGLWAAGTAGKVWPNFPALPIFDVMTKAVFFDEAVRQRFINDPLCDHDALPAAYLTALSEATSRLQDNLANVQDPLIVLQGGKDSLVPVDSSEFLMKRVGSSDKVMKLYDEVSHTTLHDAGKDEVWADILSWLGTSLRYSTPAVSTAQRREPAPAAASRAGLEPAGL
jgi:acylglycerol lipase